MTKTPDRTDIARKALGQAITHPATWAPFIPVAGAYAFLGVPWFICLLAALVVAVVVIAAWMKRWPQLVQRVRTEILAQHRQLENRDLDRRIGRLELPWQRGQGFVKDLRGAMEIKRHIEDRLWADGVLTQHEEEVGCMVADLVRIMIEEAEKFSQAKDEQPPAAVAERFEKAARTLRQAGQEINTILDPVPESMRLPEEKPDALAQASNRLDERLEQARGVRRIMERGLSSLDAAPVGGEDAAKRRPISEA